MGRYILMFMEVLKTFCKLMLPFALFIFTLSMAYYCLYYYQALSAEVLTQMKNNKLLNDSCQAGYSGSFPVGQHPLDSAVSNWYEFEYSFKVRVSPPLIFPFIALPVSNPPVCYLLFHLLCGLLIHSLSTFCPQSNKISDIPC